MSTRVENNQSGSFRASIQKLGSNLSSMIMPNIAMFIAWGLITALFIETGWLPNAELAELVGPTLNYLLPIMIAFQGGKLVYGERGGVVGAIAVMGVIVGSPIPMFIGAMIMGPLGGWAIKQLDRMLLDKIGTGFEMLYNNFSAGILGALLAVVGFYAIEPLVTAGTNLMANGVDYIISLGLLPLANIFIEPAKVLFLNNAINHGILTPLGTEQTLEAGKSILYLLEANPGPGLGVLLAFALFGKGSAKSSSLGAMIIHFFGGIHEIYFPYVMMKPSLFFAVIGGGVTGTFVNQLLDAGLQAPASPGSIIAIAGMAPRGGLLPVFAGVAAGTLVSFAIAAILLRSDKTSEEDYDLQVQAERSQAMKASSKGEAATTEESVQEMSTDSIQKVIFACDAGMGSSAMGASLLRKKFSEGEVDLDVTNTALNQLEAGSDTLVITQQELTTRAKRQAPEATHVSVDNFLQSPKYDDIVRRFSNKEGTETKAETISTDQVDEITAIEQIHVVYDETTRGSGTMRAEILRTEVMQQEKSLRIEKVALTELVDEVNTLFIVPQSLSSQVEVENKTVVEDALNEDELRNLINRY